MEMLPVFLKELEKEAVTTREMLSRVPVTSYDYKPHEKSMVMMSLITHIAELPDWISMVLTTEELDFEKTDYTPTLIKDTDELLALFEKSLEKATAELSRSKEKQLAEYWTLRSGEQIFSKETKLEAIRHAFCQIVHHRAQLGVYLRLLNVPIPGSYGPSADEQNF